MRSSKRVSVFLVGGALTIALSALAPAVYAQGTDGAIGTGNGSMGAGGNTNPGDASPTSPNTAPSTGTTAPSLGNPDAARGFTGAPSVPPAGAATDPGSGVGSMRNKPMNPSGPTNPVNPESGSSTNLGGVNP
jgi:hypothetical protein